MKKPTFILGLGLALLASAALAQTSSPSATAPKNAQPIEKTVSAMPPAGDASVPMAKKDDGAFLKKHESFLQRGKEGPIGVLFLGDSITAGWTKAPHIWEHYYGKFQPANFGIGGDRTQHVLWRIENGELDGVHPKVVVLMLGTNNSATNTAGEIAAADKKIVQMIRAKIPDTKVLLLGVFPRGPRKNAQRVVIDDGTKQMAVINAVNAELAKLDDGKNVRYLDISSKFLGDDGRIPSLIMPDQLHPNAAGYQLWAEAMQPLLTEMMK